MYPHERSLVTELHGKPFAIVGINSDKTREKAAEVVAAQQHVTRTWWDGGSTRGPIATRWNVSGWPTVYVLDHQGVIRAKGHRLDDTLVKKLVAEAEEAGKNTAGADF